MSEYTNITVERLGADDRLARITLNRPDRLNALSPDLLDEFGQALRELEEDPSARVIILRGAGRAFSAGYDLVTPRRQAEYRARTEGQRPSVWRTRTNMVRISDLYLYFWNMAKVTIAQVHGYCIAGGCEMAMMADLVIAADDAKLGHPGTRGLGTSRTAAFWPVIIGMRKSKELLFTGDNISGVEAERIGMVNKAVPAADLESTVLHWAERIANQASDSLALQKRSVNTYFESVVYPAIHSATDTDAMYQYTDQAALWQQKVRESMAEGGGGMKAAYEWRDAPYADYRAAATSST
ncbi:MAG: enoyl-CoA hydratase/isomerase family protein [Chloroflexi bacterium]|nr:enoyl-CoA hydratase/isomerase family protein [Chloroflexota bacterium]